MRKKRKNIIIIISTILCLALLAGILVFSNKPYQNPSNLLGNTPSNLYNGGTFCQRGDKVFFSNSSDKDCLYVMNKDESAPKKLVGVAVLSINADDKRVFYSLSGKSTGTGLGYVRKSTGMYSCKYDGSNSICYTQNPVEKLTLLGNSLYYTNYIKDAGTTLYGITIDKKDNHEIVNEYIDPSCIFEGWMYYSATKNDHYLHILNPVTTQSTIQTYRDVYMPIKCSDGAVYFIDPHDNYSLHRYQQVSDEDIVLSDERIDFFNIYEDMIYYQVSVGDSPALHRMQIDGSMDVIIADGIYKDIQTTSIYAYFRDYKDDSITYHVKHNSTDVSRFEPKVK